MHLFFFGPYLLIMPQVFAQGSTSTTSGISAVLSSSTVGATSLSLVSSTSASSIAADTSSSFYSSTVTSTKIVASVSVNVNNASSTIASIPPDTSPTLIHKIDIPSITCPSSDSIIYTPEDPKSHTPYYQGDRENIKAFRIYCNLNFFSVGDKLNGSMASVEDIGPPFVLGYDACVLYCASNSTCIGITWSATSNYCWLKRTHLGEKTLAARHSSEKHSAVLQWPVNYRVNKINAWFGCMILEKIISKFVYRNGGKLF